MWVQKVRTDTVTGEQKPGPWHRQFSGPLGQMWCGVKIGGFGVRRVTGGTPTGSRCPACESAYESGKPRSWRKR